MRKVFEKYIQHRRRRGKNSAGRLFLPVEVNQADTPVAGLLVSEKSP
jgi:hypothetical protein